MATYNRASSILRAISSIKNQTYNNLQLVVIDGASTDNTIEILKPFLSSGDILISEKDKGAYDAFNKGIEISNGEVIAFLHSDDFYPNKNVLKVVMNIFEDKDIDVVYGNLNFFNEKNPKKIIRCYRSDKLSKRNLAWGKMPAHPATFVRRRVYDKVGLFNINYSIAGDYEFFCRMILNYEVKSKYIPEVLVNMQTGGISTSGIKSFFILNYEVYRAIRHNGIYTNFFMLFSKYLSKVFQFIKK